MRPVFEYGSPKREDLDCGYRLNERYRLIQNIFLILCIYIHEEKMHIIYVHYSKIGYDGQLVFAGSLCFGGCLHRDQLPGCHTL